MTKTPYNFVSDERFKQLSSWLNDQGYSTDTLAPLSADAGFRRYYRLQIDGGTLVAVDAPPEYEDSESFVNIAGKLDKTGLITPEIYCYNLEKGFMLLSDLGSVHLQDTATADNVERALPLYRKALATLIKMQASTPTEGLPIYSPDFLQQELQLFPEWYLQKHMRYTCNTTTKKQLQRCFDLCIESAKAQPEVFVHRDYHCRNLMIQSDDEIGIIDFQGAVYGPVTYDLVSLLRDAYVEWPASFIDPLLDIHRQSLKTLSSGAAYPSKDTYRRWFDLMGLQRHLKILGIFCRLHYRDGKSHYLNNIPLVRKHIESVCQHNPEFSAIHDLLMEIPDDKATLYNTSSQSDPLKQKPL